VRIHQDARIYAGLFNGAQAATHALGRQRLGYLHVARGDVFANGRALSAGDALLYADEPAVSIERGKDAEVLVFDLPR
jgi:redox-sensitive bicupin YhaK (pirin superfamily)